MGRPKIESIYEGFFSGGARILHTGVALGLQDRGYDQSVTAINRETFRENTLQKMENDTSYRRLQKANIPIISLGRRAIGDSLDLTPFTEKELALFARQADAADVLFSVKEQPVRLINQLPDLETPAIVGLHRSDPEHQGSSLDDLRLAVTMGRVGCLIATAEASKDAYVDVGIPAELIQVVRNGIDLDRFSPSSDRRAFIRKKLGVSPDSPVVAFAARFDTMKDVPLFLDSARLYLEQDPSATILMCGAGMTQDNTHVQRALDKAFSGAYDLRSQLRLLGIRPDMEAIYAASDVVASTSRFGETYPLCLIEGLACGAVPVATDVGDSAHIVSEGRGIRTTRDPFVIADSWQRAYEDKPQFLEAIQATRSTFGQQDMVSAYARIIDNHVQA